MAALNYTGVSHVVFHLLGIPGLEDQHVWISIPFFVSYVTALLGNSLLIFIILTKHSLHEPMYLFLGMLAGAEIVLSTCIVPQALAIFWFHAGEISLDRCITQVFFLSSAFIYGSGILLVMAFDRYIAICCPLRYTTVLTRTLIGKIGVTLNLRSCAIFPVIFLLKRLTLCKSNILPNTACKHIVLAHLSCDDIRVNIWYGFLVLMSTLVIDVVLCADSPCCILHPFPRCSSQSSQHMWLPCLCHHPLLCTWHLLSPCSAIWTSHLTPYPCPPVQCLYSGSTYAEPHHLWDQDQTNQGPGDSCVLYKAEMNMLMETNLVLFLTILSVHEVSFSINLFFFSVFFIIYIHKDFLIFMPSSLKLYTYYAHKGDGWIPSPTQWTWICASSGR